MTLNFGNDLFGEKGLFKKESEELSTISIPQKIFFNVNPGKAATATATFIAGGLTSFKKELGYVTSIYLMNESGAVRNSTVIIRNETTGVTLYSSNVNIADSGVVIFSRKWPLDKIKPGDHIKYTIGNEGVGTAYTTTTYTSQAIAIPGSGFFPTWSTDGYIMDYGEFQSIYSVTDISAPVILPNGVTITDVKVYGSDSTESWDMYRCDLSNGDNVVSMATEDINSEDSSISYATINNGLYSYIIKSACDTGEVIHGARIEYTIPNGNPIGSAYIEFVLGEFFESDGVDI